MAEQLPEKYEQQDDFSGTKREIENSLKEIRNSLELSSKETSAIDTKVTHLETYMEQLVHLTWEEQEERWETHPELRALLQKLFQQLHETDIMGSAAQEGENLANIREALTLLMASVGRNRQAQKVVSMTQQIKQERPLFEWLIQRAA